MIELERHIEILLLSNDCVVVPGLGGFVAHYIEARYDEEDGLFLPPLRTLGFNAQLTMNDSLLAQAYVEAYDISYPEALRRIEDEVEELHQHINNEGFYELHDIGTLATNAEGHLEFHPCEAGLLTPSLYGLTSFEMPTLAYGSRGPSTVRQTGDDRAEIITIRKSTIRKIAAAAIVIFALFLIPPTTSWEPSSHIQQSSVINFQSWERPNVKPDATVEQAVTMVQQVAATNNFVKDNDYWTLVLASHISKNNAASFIASLQQKGFQQARILEQSNVIKVVYGQYPSKDNAYENLKQLKGNSDFAQAWVLEVK